MSHGNLLRKIARLESMNDQLAAELRYLDQLARALGFAHGLATLKSAALEMLAADRKQEELKNRKEDTAIEESDF